MKDTTIEEIEYGKPIKIWQNGKQLKRYYPVKFCKACGEQIKVKIRQKGPDAGRLQTTSEFALKSSYCGLACRNAENSIQANVRKKIAEEKALAKKNGVMKVELTEVDLWLTRPLIESRV